jgi:hypothetical protein
LLYTCIGSLWALMADWNVCSLMKSLNELPAALFSGFKLTWEFFDPSNYRLNEWIFVGSHQTVETVGAFDLCVQKAGELTKSVKIIDAEQFFGTFDKIFFPSNKNRLFVLVKLEDQAGHLMHKVLLTFLSKKKARFT